MRVARGVRVSWGLPMCCHSGGGGGGTITGFDSEHICVVQVQLMPQLHSTHCAPCCCSFSPAAVPPSLPQVSISTDPYAVFQDAEWALMIGAKPRGPGQERADLLDQNGRIFVEQVSVQIQPSSLCVLLSVSPQVVLQYKCCFHKRRWLECACAECVDLFCPGPHSHESESLTHHKHYCSPPGQHPVLTPVHCYCCCRHPHRAVP